MRRKIILTVGLNLQKIGMHLKVWFNITTRDQCGNVLVPLNNNTYYYSTTANLFYRNIFDVSTKVDYNFPHKLKESLDKLGYVETE